MTSSFDAETGVALRGQIWEINNFRFFESSQPDVILYITNRSFLSVNADDRRYQVSLTVFHQWSQGTDLVKRGALSFTTTLMPKYDFLTLEALKQEWEKKIIDSGYVTEQNLQFLPLPVRNIRVQILLDPSIGKITIPQIETASFVTAGETTSFVVELTEKGVQKWVENINSQTNLTGELTFTYEYPQVLPQVEVRIKVKGKSTFTYLASVLAQKKDGYYGSREQIEAAWEELIQNQIIEIKLPEPLPPELTEMQQNLLNTFAEQVHHYLFDQLFMSVAETGGEPSEGSNSGVMYKLKWRQETDSVDLNFKLSVNGGWTWLKGSMSTGFTTLFREIDSSYINTVYIEQAFPISITVQGNSLLSTVALSWSTNEGKLPEALIFAAEGGKKEYTLTSRNPENVTIRYQARVGFKLAKWPVIEIEKATTVAQSGNQILLQPSQWIRHLTIHLLIREGNQTKPPADLPHGDYLVVNVSYTGAHLPTRIRESARISPVAPMQFTYLQDPKGRPSQLYLNAVGVLGGRMIQVPQQLIHSDEESVFILVGHDGVQVVSQESVVSENDRLAERLLDEQLGLVITQIP